MKSIFSKIISRELPAHIIDENDKCLAFLDAFPLVKGHVLVIPKKEEDYIFNIDSEEYISLWNFAKKIAKAMDSTIECKRIAVVVIGLEVPHTHIHLIPINSVNDINFEKEKLKLSQNQFFEIAQNIRSAI